LLSVLVCVQLELGRALSVVAGIAWIAAAFKCIVVSSVQTPQNFDNSLRPSLYRTAFAWFVVVAFFQPATRAVVSAQAF